jgi:hypothetical protein
MQMNRVIDHLDAVRYAFPHGLSHMAERKTFPYGSDITSLYEAARDIYIRKNMYPTLHTYLKAMRLKDEISKECYYSMKGQAYHNPLNAMRFIFKRSNSKEACMAILFEYNRIKEEADIENFREADKDSLAKH